MPSTGVEDGQVQDTPSSPEAVLVSDAIERPNPRSETSHTSNSNIARGVTSPSNSRVQSMNDSPHVPPSVPLFGTARQMPNEKSPSISTHARLDRERGEGAGEPAAASDKYSVSGPRKRLYQDLDDPYYGSKCRRDRDSYRPIHYDR